MARAPVGNAKTHSTPSHDELTTVLSTQVASVAAAADSVRDHVGKEGGGHRRDASVREREIYN